MATDYINADTVSDINSIDLRVAELDAEREALLQRRQYLLSLPNIQKNHSILTTDQKVFLFDHLFKGRRDVYATRWQNTKDRNGYSVACNNEWVQNICSATIRMTG